MILAGLLYSSWPLGYLLNPNGAKGVVSNLQGMHQPYNWFFIVLDVICGALIIGAMWWLLKFVRSHKRKPNRIWFETAIIGLGVFGLLTAIDAVLPLQCNEAVEECLPPLEDPYFVVHGIVSIASVAGLTMSIVAVWWLVTRDKRAVHINRWVLHALLFVWFCFAVGTAVLVAYDRTSGLAQRAFILFCSFWLAIIPYYIWNVLHIRPKFTKPTRKKRIKKSS